MGGSRVSWAASVIAPWALACGLVVSITARADPDPDTGGLTRPLRSSGDFAISGARLIEANYAVGDPDELASLPDEIEPRFAAKRDVATVINRARKGDPFVALRPGFEAKAHAPAEEVAAASISPAAPVPAPAVEPAKPVPAPAPPAVLASAGVSVAFKAPSAAAPRTDLSDRPGYASLINPRDRAREMRCLAEAHLFRGAQRAGGGSGGGGAGGAQTACAAASTRPRYAASSTRTASAPFACQFSFACEGKSLRVEEPTCRGRRRPGSPKRWSGAKAYDPKRFASAINYHAAYVRPFWALDPEAARPHRPAHLLRDAPRPLLGARRPQRARRPAAAARAGGAGAAVKAVPTRASPR